MIDLSNKSLEEVKKTFDMLDINKINIGTSKLQLVKNGIYVNKYKITIPKELNDYE